MENNMIEVEIRTVNEFGDEEHMVKKFNSDSTENGLDAYLLYEQFIYFMKMCGYADGTIAQIQYIED